MKRIQVKGNYYNFRQLLPNTAVYCGRPSRWGNPYKVPPYGLEDALDLYRSWLREQLSRDAHFLEPLVDKDLACWCPLNQSCHVDIILQAINELRQNR